MIKQRYSATAPNLDIQSQQHFNIIHPPTQPSRKLAYSLPHSQSADIDQLVQILSRSAGAHRSKKKKKKKKRCTQSRRSLRPKTQITSLDMVSCFPFTHRRRVEKKWNRVVVVVGVNYGPNLHEEKEKRLLPSSTRCALVPSSACSWCEQPFPGGSDLSRVYSSISPTHPGVG